MLRRAALLPVLVLLLHGCATPLERCVSQARASQSAAENELRELERTLARGYATERRVRTRPVFGSCYAGPGKRYPCVGERAYPYTARVKVDLGQVQRRADELRARLPALTRSAEAGAAQCRAAYAASLAPEQTPG
ncbi:hypothetical protein ROJ8625_02583 [Roseivivax jejudonensis]|uniref:Lipoprotein n=1 Tax=Roseivivax jejudonensis TaxID=1529041 RepID=A0A1X6ZK06_9RHOB|nr:hypothetical protein [Roseivivax jejudonensis]SLN51686.1 hypothetical protein ROJ8625_02583 [Roseivivax jejudonensis]